MAATKERSMYTVSKSVIWLPGIERGKVTFDSIPRHVLAGFRNEKKKNIKEVSTTDRQSVFYVSLIGRIRG
jgi:hypothetical protein